MNVKIMDYLINLIEKLEKPSVLKFFNTQLKSIRDGHNKIFQSEYEFLSWFEVNVLVPERNVLLQNKLSKVFNSNNILPEIKKILTKDTETSLDVFQQHRSQKDINNLFRLINSFYIMNNHKNDYETPGSSLNSEEINKQIQKYISLYNNKSEDTNEIEESLSWLDDFIYKKVFHSGIENFK